MKAAIDSAFTAVTNALVAYWTLDTVGQANGTGGARPYLNIINNTPYDLVTSATPLTVKLDAFFLDTAAGQWRNAGYTSYGTISGVTTGGSATSTDVSYTRGGTTYKAGEWTWNAGGSSKILSSKAGNDNVADLAFTNSGSLVRNPPGTVVCSTLTSAPNLKPS